MKNENKLLINAIALRAAKRHSFGSSGCSGFKYEKIYNLVYLSREYFFLEIAYLILLCPQLLRS